MILVGEGQLLERWAMHQLWLFLLVSIDPHLDRKHEQKNQMMFERLKEIDCDQAKSETE